MCFCYLSVPIKIPAMGIKIISAEDINNTGNTILTPPQEAQPITVTINSQGIITFDGSSADRINLKQYKAVKFAVDEEDSEVRYIILCPQEDKDSFPIQYIMSQWVIRGGSLIEKLGLDFSRKTRYELIRDDNVPDMEVYRMEEISLYKR